MPLNPAGVPSRADIQAAIDEAVAPLTAPWTSYVPTWDNTTTNPVIGNGSLTGAYSAAGKLIHFRLELRIGSTTTLGTGAGWTFGLPVQPKALTMWQPIGHSLANDVSALATAIGQAGVAAGASGFIVRTPAAASSSTYSQAAPWTWATGDTLCVVGTYEAA